MYARALDRYCTEQEVSIFGARLRGGERYKCGRPTYVALEGRCDADMDDKEKHGEMQSH